MNLLLPTLIVGLAAQQLFFAVRASLWLTPPGTADDNDEGIRLRGSSNSQRQAISGVEEVNPVVPSGGGSVNNISDEVKK